MNQTISLQQLTDRIDRVEKEMGIIRKELAYLRRRRTTVPFAVPCLWADKEEQRHWIRDVFAALAIQGVPMGTKGLQERMSQASLTPNELSRSLVEAREE